MKTKQNEERCLGTVFDIERFSLHDGRGIRTVVYLKGCPLRCSWCHNPESNRAEPQIGFYPERCGGCGACVKVCPNGALFGTKGRIEREKCTGCLKCVEVCPYEARVAYGRKMTPEEVVRQVLRDRVFYKNSEGGVTLSGGEVSMQPAFASEVLRLCQKEGIHTAIETCGFCNRESFEAILVYVDQLLYDIKCMDPEIHRRYTGVDNRLILENASRASEVVKEMVVRWPVIPGVNDTAENAEALADFMRERMPVVKRVDLLPYHSVGKSKCACLDREYGYEMPYELTGERVEQLKCILGEKGLDARIGG